MILFEHLWNLVHLVPPWLCERILENNIPIIRWFVYDINAIKKPECLRIVCLTVKCSFRSSPLSCRVEHAINRILGTNTPLFLKAQNYPVLALTKINVVIYSSRSEIKGFLKMLLNEFVCGRIITRQYGPGIACRQTEGSGSPESELVTSERWGQVLWGVRNSILGRAFIQNLQENSQLSLSIYHNAPFI